MKPRVTDHALVRWMDRSGAMNIEAVREALACSLERAFTAATTLGAARFLIRADGLVFIVEGDTVVTVVEDDGRHDHARQLRPRERPLS